MNTITNFNYNQFFEQQELLKPSMNELNAENNYKNALLILTISLVVLTVVYYLTEEEKDHRNKQNKKIQTELKRFKTS